MGILRIDQCCGEEEEEPHAELRSGRGAGMQRPSWRCPRARRFDSVDGVRTGALHSNVLVAVSAGQRINGAALVHVVPSYFWAPNCLVRH